MADIAKKVQQIRQAVYGKDVRESIASGIEAINEEVENTTSRQNVLETTFEQLIINAGNSNAEIVAARVDANGTAYPTLGDRLNALGDRLNDVDVRLADIMQLNLRDFLDEGTHTQALQAAIDAAPSDGAEIIIPKGEWSIDKVTIKSNIIIRGMKGAKIKQLTEETPFQIVSASNVIIDNLVFEGLPNNTLGGSTVVKNQAIYIGHSNNVVIKNCEIYNFYNDAIHCYNSTNVKFYNNHFHDIGYRNTDVDTPYNATPPASWTIFRIKGVDNTTKTDGIDIINNEIHGALNTLISLEWTKNVKIVGNKIYDTDSNHIQFGNSDNIYIGNNIILQGKRLVSGEGRCISAHTNCTNITIANNEIFSIFSYGINTKDSTNTKITNNKIISPTVVEGSIGIVAWGDGCEIANNYITGCENGIYFDGANLNIIGNVIDTVVKYGIRDYDYGASRHGNCNIIGNTINNSTAGYPSIQLNYDNHVKANKCATRIYLNNLANKMIANNNASAIEDSTGITISDKDVIFLGNRKVYLGTAPPTSGTWLQGDIVINKAPVKGGVMGWVCTTGGTPGTWQAFGQAGYRLGSGSPLNTVTPNYLGEEYFDSTNKIWYKSVGYNAWDWVQISN